MKKKIQNVGLKPWMSASNHGYAHDALDRLNNDMATRKDIEIELSKRIEEKETRRLLNEIIWKKKNEGE